MRPDIIFITFDFTETFEPLKNSALIILHVPTSTGPLPPSGITMIGWRCGYAK